MRAAVTPCRRGGSGRPLPRRLRILAILLPLAFSAGTPASAGDSLRCGSRIVSLRAIGAEVAAICGEPAYVDRWETELPLTGQPVGDTEIWYYNFGGNQLLRVLKFRNGRLASVDTDGYGFDGQADGHCGPGEIVEGESKFRLLTRCGDPVARRVTGALRSVQPQSRIYRRYESTGYNDYVTPVYREEWVYNFGPRYRQRTVTLENGWVVDVADGGPGFDQN